MPPYAPSPLAFFKKNLLLVTANALLFSKHIKAITLVHFLFPLSQTTVPFVWIVSFYLVVDFYTSFKTQFICAHRCEFFSEFLR